MNRHTVLKLIIIYILGAALYTILASFNKNLIFVPDERLYIQAAKAFASGNGMYYNGMKSTYQKLLYPLIISPAFLASNIRLQLFLIALISSLFEMTAIFPIYLICTRLRLGQRLSTIITSCSVLFPAFLFSSTFMSESVYIAVWLWMIYLIVIFLDSSNIKWYMPILIGTVGYLLYLDKEVGIVAIPALVLVTFIAMIRSAMKSPAEDRSIRNIITNIDGRRFLYSIVAGLIFGVYFLLGKYFLFSSMSPSYSYQISSVGDSLRRYVYYAIYAAFFYIIYIILATFIFPVFMRLSLDETAGKLKLYIEVSILVLIFVVVNRVTMNEDFGSLSPRLHLRYIEPLFIPYLITFLAGLGYREGDTTNKGATKNKSFLHNKWIRLLFPIYILALIIIPGLTTDGFLDSTTVMPYMLPQMVAIKFYVGSHRVELIGNIILKALILIYIYIGMRLLDGRGIFTRKSNSGVKKRFVPFLLGFVVLISVMSLALKYRDIREAYHVSDEYIDQFQALNDEIDNLEGDKLIIVPDSSRACDMMITFYDIGQSDIYVVDIGEDFAIDAEISLRASNAYRSVRMTDYDYLIIGPGILDETGEEQSSASLSSIYKDGLFTIYRCGGM